MNQLSEAGQLKRKACDLLARRDYSAHLLRQKLEGKGYNLSLIDELIEILQEEKLLSDQRYTKSLIRYRAERGSGPLRIKQELQHAGIKTELIETALAECCIDWARQAKRVWQKKFKGKIPDEPKELAKQQRFLLYRGYRSEEISALCSEG